MRAATRNRPPRSSTPSRYAARTPCPRASRGYDAGKKINGTKRHLAVDTGGLLLAVIVTMAGLQDRDAAHRLLAGLRERFTTITLVWADAGYAGRLLVWARNVLHLTVQIVKRTEPGFVVLPRRWVVERTFAWISKHRRLVRDYETKPGHHEAMIYIVMIMTRRSRPCPTAGRCGRANVTPTRPHRQLVTEVPGRSLRDRNSVRVVSRWP
ncbi:transposase [Micromonospora sp. ATA32]|nr:transposase [Micromonospora sp. ATA32]